jgi:long-chain acyl-CoA synthetase
MSLVTWSAILDSIRAAELKPTPSNLELYRKDVWVTPAPPSPPVRLSVIDIAPERPEQTLVLIHGFAASSAWWYHQVNPLAQRNRVLAIELRGHGRSSRPEQGYTVSQMADDIALALEALEIEEPVTAVGHSAGGFIAADLALRHPERVGKLVLVATPIAIERRALPLRARISASCPDFLLRAMQPLYEMDPKGRGSAYLLGVKRLFNDDLVHWDGTRKFPHLAQPTLVIVGDRDYVFPEEYYTQVAELVPQAELVNVGVSKHQVPLERPKAVLRAIERFIEPSAVERFEPRWRSENDDVDSIRLLAERPWIARYEGHVPPTLDIPQVPLTRLLEYAARRFPRRAAVHCQNQTLSYRDLNTEAGRFAAALQELGVAKGKRVMLLLPNTPHFVAAFYGTLRLGAIAVLSNPLEQADEIVRQAQQTGAQVLVAAGRSAEVAGLLRNQSEVRHVIYTQDHLWSQLLAQASHLTVPSGADVHPGDTAAVLFTAGTTGSPKGVKLSHRNLVANALQVGTWLSSVRARRPTILCTVPFSHAYGMTLGMNLAIYLAAGTVSLPAFDPRTVLEHVKRHKPTLFVATPAQYLALNSFSGIRDYTSDALHLCISASAPLPVEVKEAFERLTKVRIIEGYGLTEATLMTHVNPVNENRTGSVGLPLPGTEARIVDLSGGQPLPCGQAGELLVRGPQVMQGYWNKPDTQTALDADGWLHTGDAACMDDDGYFQILGRRRDIWTDDEGCPIFPRDVEETMYELPEVNEVAVVATENRLVAFVVLRAGDHISSEDILQFCRHRLSPSHVPRRVVFVDELPRNHIGKILTRRILDIYHASGASPSTD